MSGKGADLHDCANRLSNRQRRMDAPSPYVYKVIWHQIKVLPVKN